jgi:nicotinate-nucleotide adenylyltransferase
MQPHPRIVFGGAFDPVHAGHLALAEFVSAEMSDARVLFMPAALSPFKTGHHLNFDQRAQMLARALSETDFELDLREGTRTGPSYTVQTLRELSIEEDSPLYLLIGEDNLRDFKEWKDWETILKLATIVVVNRPALDPSPKDTLEQNLVPHQLLHWPGMALSSTWLRERLASSKSCKQLLPHGVWDLIQEKHFYGTTGGHSI